LHYTPNANPKARRLMFIHGNSYSADAYDKALKRVALHGYDVWVCEFGGFGMAPGLPEGPTPDSVLQDVMEAWAICGHADAIVAGFSLGGAILGQVYDRFVPLPAQLVFLNTFWSFPSLVQEKLETSHGTLIGEIAEPLLECRWRTKPPVRFKGKVVVVWSADDDLIPPEHTRELCSLFAKLKPRCIELPRGGHRYSALVYLSSWCNSSILLSP